MLEDLVRRAAEELRLREQAIDEVMARARRARVQSKQAIQQIHVGAMDEAQLKLGEVAEILRAMEELIAERAELGCFDAVKAALQEYSEARILHGVVSSGTLPTPEEVGVSIDTYILGLGDVPGELRRQFLDALRLGDLETAEDRLDTMEGIYLGLVSMEEGPLLKGLRRKMDIARGVIERTRSELTAEVGRRRLSESVKRLSEKLG
jgi:translin